MGTIHLGKGGIKGKIKEERGKRFKKKNSYSFFFLQI